VCGILDIAPRYLQCGKYLFHETAAGACGAAAPGAIMSKRVIGIFVSAVFLALLFSTCITDTVAAVREETLLGAVVMHGGRFVVEADDGDYILKGKDLSRLVGKLVEVTGIITESDKGEVIEVESILELEDTVPE